MAKKKKSSNKDGVDSVLDDLIASMNKSLPDDDIILDFETGSLEIPRIPTGIVGLDYILGGGIPKGRSMEVYGPESSGKSTLALHLAAAVHANDDKSIIAIVDTEHAMDKRYMMNLGIDPKRTILYQPNRGETALNAVVDFARKGVDFILLDSIATTTPSQDLDKSLGESTMGTHAKLMGDFWKQVTPVVSKSGSILVCINQTREKIGVVYGSPITTPGGNATKFHCSIRLTTNKSVSKQNQVLDEGEITGNRISIKSIKNKTAPPLRELNFNILYGIGIDYVLDMLEWAVELKVVDKGGSWYTLPNGEKMQGENKVLEYLKENADEYLDIKKQVVQLIN